MKTSFNTRQLGLAAACALALGIMSGTISAQAATPIDQTALINGPQQLVWTDGFGNCWHSDFGPPPQPNVLCGPQPVAEYVAPAPAPVAQAAPAPQPVTANVS